MRVSQLGNLTHGLFYYINETTPVPWSDIFSVDKTDTLYTSLYGMRELITDTDYTDETLPDVAQQITTLYMDNWKDQFEIYNKELTTNDYDSSETGSDETTGSITNSTEYGNKQHTVDKISAYDVDSFSDDTTTDVEHSGTDKATQSFNDYLINHQHKKTGNTASIISKRGKFIDDLKLNYLRDIVFKDVNSFLTYSIYSED